MTGTHRTNRTTEVAQGTSTAWYFMDGEVICGMTFRVHMPGFSSVKLTQLKI
jgi:hypothetical protein